MTYMNEQKIPIFLFKLFEQWHLNSFFIFYGTFLSDLLCGDTKETLDDIFSVEPDRHATANTEIM